MMIKRHVKAIGLGLLLFVLYLVIGHGITILLRLTGIGFNHFLSTLYGLPSWPAYWSIDFLSEHQWIQKQDPIMAMVVLLVYWMLVGEMVYWPGCFILARKNKSCQTMD